MPYRVIYILLGHTVNLPLKSNQEEETTMP